MSAKYQYPQEKIVIYDSSKQIDELSRKIDELSIKPVKKPFIKKFYSKESSEPIKLLTVFGVPLVLASLKPCALICKAGEGVQEAITKFVNAVTLQFSAVKLQSYNDDNKSGNDTGRHAMYKDFGMTFFNSSLMALSVYSVIDLYNKYYHQGTQKLLNIEVDGNKTQIIAKGTIPLSSYLSDLFLIGGAAGYFASEDTFTKGLFIAAGSLGNIMCKAFADDSNDYMNSEYEGKIQQVNSNNVNINIGNRVEIGKQGHSNNSSNSDADPYNNPIACAVVATAIASYYLISDSTPGNYVYKFYNKSGQELPITLEWHDNSDYSLVDQYGEEITVLS